LLVSKTGRGMHETHHLNSDDYNSGGGHWGVTGGHYINGPQNIGPSRIGGSLRQKKSCFYVSKGIGDGGGGRFWGKLENSGHASRKVRTRRKGESRESHPLLGRK